VFSDAVHQPWPSVSSALPVVFRRHHERLHEEQSCGETELMLFPSACCLVASLVRNARAEVHIQPVSKTLGVSI
jgi:hypothetical protein